jgi:hypothetical protein
VCVLVLVWRVRHCRHHVFVLVRIVLVQIVVVIMGVAMTGHSPNEEAQARQNQNGAYDVALLDVDLLLKAQANQCDHAGERE